MEFQKKSQNIKSTAGIVKNLCKFQIVHDCIFMNQFTKASLQPIHALSVVTPYQEWRHQATKILLWHHCRHFWFFSVNFDVEIMVRTILTRDANQFILFSILLVKLLLIDISYLLTATNFCIFHQTYPGCKR